MSYSVEQQLRQPRVHEKFINRALRFTEGQSLHDIKAKTAEVNAFGAKFEGASREDLRKKTDEFKDRLKNGETLEDILPEAFAVVREASHQILGMRHFDQQVMGAIAIHRGSIAEMKTGEGKTLTALMPAYLHALQPDNTGVHVMTVNEYLAKRDFEWMGQVHKELGLTVGITLDGMSNEAKKNAYSKDIVYGTTSEFGFDYLRDNIADSPEKQIQRGHGFAIVDEIDSILIDEARTPLRISGDPMDSGERWYPEFARLVKRMERQLDENNEGDYEVDEVKRTVAATAKGIKFIEDQLGIENLYSDENVALVSYLNNALKAKELYKKRKDYIEKDGEILIVDEYTGRTLQGRRYNEGLHPAIEAKEGVEIKPETPIEAIISIQNYIRKYEKLSGMTGTASTEASEFEKIFKLPVVEIPTHKPVIRKDYEDEIYKSEKAKFEAVVEEIIERYAKGQPILVGTIDVEKSEILSKMLKKRGIPHNVLNAENDALEAEIVAQAGRLKAVTISTDMAGRGTDILLGGNPEDMANKEMELRGISKEDNKDKYDVMLSWYKKRTEAEKAKVIELGGLYVLGTERHDSRRIDNQLRGRAGRQGDPGESQFFVSIQDKIIKKSKTNSRKLKAIFERFRIPDVVPVTFKRAINKFKDAQTQIEQENADIRREVLKYDDVLKKQRDEVYNDRQKIVESKDLHPAIEELIQQVVEPYITEATQGYPEDWELDALWANIATIHPLSFSPDEYTKASGGERTRLEPEPLKIKIIIDLLDAYDKRRAEVVELTGYKVEGEDAQKVSKKVVNAYEKLILLDILDSLWKDHISNMEYIREGVGLRGYAQKDPLVEYTQEASAWYNVTRNEFKKEAVTALFNTPIEKH